MEYNVDELNRLLEEARRRGGALLGAVHVKPKGEPIGDARFTNLLSEVPLKRKWDSLTADESLEIGGVLFGNPARMAYVHVDVEDPDLFDVEWCARNAMKRGLKEALLSEYLSLPEEARRKKPENWLQPVSADEVSGGGAE